MDKIKLIFILDGDDELKLKSRDFLMKNNRVKLINAEYIPWAHDSGMEPYESLKHEWQREVRRNSSIKNLLSNNNKPGEEYHLILEIDTLTSDVAARYSRDGIETGHMLTSLSVSMAIKNDDVKQIIYLKSSYFEIISEMLRNSTDNARIISGSTEEVRYKEFAAALHEKSTLIIINGDLVGTDQESHFTAFSTAFGHSVLKMSSGTVDVTSPVLKINGKDYVSSKKSTQKPVSNETISAEIQNDSKPALAIVSTKKNSSIKNFFKMLMGTDQEPEKKLVDPELEKKKEIIKQLQAKTAEKMAGRETVPIETAPEIIVENNVNTPLENPEIEQKVQT